MNLLFLTTQYPAENDFYNYYFVHPRVLEFLAAGHQVDVVSFESETSYYFKNVFILCERDWLSQYAGKPYDAVISHSPGIKKHLYLINRMHRQFRKIVLVLNGGEGMKRYRYFIDRYAYQKGGLYPAQRLMTRLVDDLRALLLRIFIKKFLAYGKLKIIVTSEWMKSQFFKDIRVPEDLMRGHIAVIPNPIGDAFLEGNYSPAAAEKYADFITLRPLNTYRYALDIVWQIAKQNPEYIFHVYGEGDFFRHNPPLPNMQIFYKFIPNQEIPALLNHYRAALMPTRSDSQGIMACEMATYGIPLLTSKIEPTLTVLKDFKNVYFLDNDRIQLNAKNFFEEAGHQHPVVKHPFDRAHTIMREIHFIQEIIRA